MIIQSFSWTIYDDKTAIKRTDRSIFNAQGSAIPIDIRSFFSIEQFEKGDKTPITLIFNNTTYKAKLEKTRSSANQTRIMYNSDLSKVFNSKYPNVLETHKFPELRFTKINNTTYQLDFLTSNETIEEKPVEVDTLESIVPAPGNKEGRKILYYTTKYERNSANRKRAIAKHGTRCMACGFNFEEVYGEQGRGIIDVHHVKPLYDLNMEVEINPETDLICLCPNCHRMVHSIKGRVLSLEELKTLIKENGRRK